MLVVHVKTRTTKDCVYNQSIIFRSCKEFVIGFLLYVFNGINLVLIRLYNCHKYEYFNIASQNGSNYISSLAITHYNVYYIVLITTFC